MMLHMIQNFGNKIVLESTFPRIALLKRRPKYRPKN